MSMLNDNHTRRLISKGLGMALPLLLGGLLLVAVMFALSGRSPVAHADPIPWPEGYPKFKVSIKTVTPTLASEGGATLNYVIEIINTGALTATDVTLTDNIPVSTTYATGSAAASAGNPPGVAGGTLTWTGQVGFDSTVVVSFSVDVDSNFAGEVINTAVISNPLIADPVAKTVETMVTDDAILTIEKTSEPAKPGANKPVTYTIVVGNEGQPAVGLSIVVTDRVPADTAFIPGSCSGCSLVGTEVTWDQPIDLATGEAAEFAFSVMVGNVPSGTIITNDQYGVSSMYGVAAGEPYTVTVVDPILLLRKRVWPDPPGSNREMTYTLTVLNIGSLATDLVVTDEVPGGVEYRRGGSELGGTVSWEWPSLDTNEFAEFTFTVYISDVMGIQIVNDNYEACSSEGVCVQGRPLTSVILGPTFELFAMVDPIAKKPGGGATGTPVTPTLVVHNAGPGNALDAQATLYFDRISVSANDLYAIPDAGTAPPFPDGPECGEKCRSYVWVGDLFYGDIVTFTTTEAQSTIGGEEGTPYTATIVVTDTQAGMTTEPVTATAIGLVTHFANVEPIKSAAPTVGPGMLLTYTIDVWNYGLTTDGNPVLTDVVPVSTTFQWASDPGSTFMISDTVVVSWTLPELSPGEHVQHSFCVLVDEDLISGTEIVNSDYYVLGYTNRHSDTLPYGEPVTTIVREVGLIDSYKEITPTVVLPGPGAVLTYYVHIVNSGPQYLAGVTMYDWLPWEYSTYQRDAVASAGEVYSDIVSVWWEGDVAPFSSEVVTLTVLVDPDYEGIITNTAVISHPSLLQEVVVGDVGYVSDDPVLLISKTAAPDPVARGEDLLYSIKVENLGELATLLVITDLVPTDTSYVYAADSGVFAAAENEVSWDPLVLDKGESRIFHFWVQVNTCDHPIVNYSYGVSCAEGVTAVGLPLTTEVDCGIGAGMIYLPLVARNA